MGVRSVNPEVVPGRGRFGRPRGLTILEVVGAVAVLAMITATVTIAINYMVAQSAREKRILAAMEVANRLILIFLDDDVELPPLTEPIEYAGESYMYTLKDDRVGLRDNLLTAERQAARRGGLARDRIRQITVRVHLSQDAQGRRYESDNAPFAVLSRLYDPFPLQRNPDSLQNMINTERGNQRLINQVLGGSQP